MRPPGAGSIVYVYVLHPLNAPSHPPAVAPMFLSAAAPLSETCAIHRPLMGAPCYGLAVPLLHRCRHRFRLERLYVLLMWARADVPRSWRKPLWQSGPLRSSPRVTNSSAAESRHGVTSCVAVCRHGRNPHDPSTLRVRSFIPFPSPAAMGTRRRPHWTARCPGHLTASVMRIRQRARGAATANSRYQCPLACLHSKESSTSAPAIWYWYLHRYWYAGLRRREMCTVTVHLFLFPPHPLRQPGHRLDLDFS